MSYPINQRFNPNQQPSMGVNAPQVQNVNTDTVAQGITQNSVLKGVGNSNDDKPWMTPLLTVPVGIGMVYGMDKFNKACSGEYTKSLVGRVGSFGQRIGEKVPYIDSFFEKVAKGYNSLKAKIIPKSRILSAFSYAPSVPKSHMVLMMANGTKAEVASDAVQKLTEHVKKGGTLVPLDGSKFNKTVMEKYLEDLSKEAHTQEGIEKVIQLCEKQGLKATTKIENICKIPFSKGKYLSDYITQIKGLGREINFSEYTNKLKALTRPEFASTVTKPNFLGKNLPKAMIRVLEGLTNGTAGGKVAVLMGAYFVADAIKKAIDAPSGNGEKRKTFAENMIYNVGWYLTMPLGISIMHRLGGFQYIGMGKGKAEITAKLKEFRSALTSFNEKAAKGGFAKRDEYKKELDVIKSMLKGDTKLSEAKGLGKVSKGLLNVIYKPLKAAARILTVGLEGVRPYIKDVKPATTSGKIAKFIKEIPYNFKRGAGYPMRFGVFMFLIAPPLAKLAAKGSHIIFGKPTKSVLDEGKEPEQKKEAQPLIIPQQNTVSQQVPQGMIQANQQNAGLANNQILPVQKENLVGNSVNQRNVMTSAAPQRSYIPSENGIVVTHNQEIDKDKGDKINQALSKANSAETAAGKYLKH